MYPLVRRAADVAVHTLHSSPDEQFSESVASWVDAQLGDKSDPLAKRVRALLSLHLARQLLDSWDATEISQEVATRIVDEVATTLVRQGREHPHSIPEISNIAGVSTQASILRDAVTIASGGKGSVANLALVVNEYLEPPHNAGEWRRAWWTTWLTETLDRVYKDAVTTLEPECLLSAYFCATENHVIAPDLDMHIALEDDALHMLALGTQFDLRRPARIGDYHAPGPIAFMGRNIVLAPLQAADRYAVAITPRWAEDWQLKRPVPAQTMAAPRWFARRTRRDPSVPASVLVPSHPHNRTVARSEVRSGVVNAIPQGAMIARLVVRIDLGQERPLQLTIFGLREMWAGLWILHRWLGDALTINATWNHVAWQFLGP